METWTKGPDGSWEQVSSPEPIPSPTPHRRIKVFIRPNWPMIILILIALPCAGYLVSGPPQKQTTIQVMPEVEAEPSIEEIEVVVDSIFRSIKTNKKVLYTATDKSRFKEWMHYLKAREGFMATPYRCPAGYLTVGYGHNVDAHSWARAKRYMQNGKISYKNATALLYEDVKLELDLVTKLAPHLNRNQAFAVASLFANCGSGKIIGTKKKPTRFWKDIMAGRTPDFSPYCKYRAGRKIVVAKNLVAARSFEQSLFEGGIKPVKIWDGRKMQTVSFAKAAQFYQVAVIKRDILPAHKAGLFD